MTPRSEEAGLGGMKAVAIRWAEQEAARKARKRPVRIGEVKTQKTGPEGVGWFIKGRDERLGFGGFRESHTKQTEKFSYQTGRESVLAGNGAESTAGRS